MSRPCIILRVFTRDGGGGNHLGVVNDVTGLDASTMQAIAADLGFSETVFIDSAAGDVPLVRIFTPVMEMPFAGHPLVGAAWVMLRLGPGGMDRLRCGIGDVTIRRDGDLCWIDTTIDPTHATPDKSDFAQRAGLGRPVAAHRVAMPLDYRVVELAATSAVAAVAPQTDALREPHGTMVYARDAGQVRARFFIPRGGIAEDPATGSAAVALATVRAASGEPSGRLTIHQGEEIGFPSRIELTWDGTTASIGGVVTQDEVRLLE